MIHYALQCATGHDFDGWFRNSASFDDQAQRGLLACPVCADTSVRRALMAPSVRTRAAAAPVETPAAPAAPPAGAARDATPPQAVATPGTALGAGMPDQMRAALQRIRAEVEKNCDYVGANFAEEARGIAAGAIPPRAIYGEATPEQEAELADEGIDVARIPWVPRASG
jgi:hypothetical protein